MPATSAGSGSGLRRSAAPHERRVSRAHPGQPLRSASEPDGSRSRESEEPVRDHARDERSLASAELLDLPQQRAAVDEAGVGEGGLRGVVDDVLGVEAHPAQDEALRERLHVAALQALREQHEHERHGRRDGEQHGGGGERGEGEREGHDRAAGEGADLVHGDVDERLDAPLLGLGQGCVQQLVARAEERVRERLVGPADERGRGEPGEKAPRSPPRRWRRDEARGAGDARAGAGRRD